jgi:hypothetical protein
MICNAGGSPAVPPPARRRCAMRDGVPASGRRNSRRAAGATQTGRLEAGAPVPISLTPLTLELVRGSMLIP